MKFAFLGSVLGLLVVGCIGCSNSALTTSGTGVLYVAAQGNTSLSPFGIDLTTGLLSTSTNTASTGNMPSAAVIAPSGGAIFVANGQDNTISSFTVNPDGTVKAAGTATALKAPALNPVGLAIDAAGKFLFVANQGTFNLTQTSPTPVKGSISVLAVNGTTLSEIAGSPFLTEQPADVIGSGPVSVAVAPNGNYLYVANQFTNTVSAYSLSSGALTLLPGSPYNVGTTPSAVAITPDGNFVYVANSGSNNVSAFAACTNANLTCVTPTGQLTPVAGSPFSAGVGPVAILAVSSPLAEFLYVVDHGSNQVSQYRVATGTGVLTAATTAAVSTGTGPTAITAHIGTSTVLADGGETDYVYVANTDGGTISSYSYDSTGGGLSVVGGPIATQGQPTALVAR